MFVIPLIIFGGFIFAMSRLLGPTLILCFSPTNFSDKKYYVKLEPPSNPTHDHASYYLCFYIKIYTRVTLIDFIYGQVRPGWKTHHVSRSSDEKTR